MMEGTRCVFLLVLSVFALGACSFHPRYQPLGLNSALVNVQGYHDIQIDESTYFVTYQNYNGVFGSKFSEKWLKGAQEYALYRAGELAKSKGANYFVVLYKDDWNLTDIMHNKYGPIDIIRPGAGLVIRVWSDYPFAIQPNDDRVYEVDTLLRSLPKKNSGLADYEKKNSPGEFMENTGNEFHRWRTSVNAYDSVPVPGYPVKTLFGEHFKFVPGINITKRSIGNFKIAIWNKSFLPVLPISVVRECATLAEREGFEAFKLENWTVEEHRDDPTQVRLGRVWFKTSVDVILQHQKEFNSLDPVFIVEEIRPNVLHDHAKP